MKVAELIALCAIFGVAHSYHYSYWVAHTGICRNSHGFSFNCVHYSNCRKTFRNPFPRAQSKICGVYYGAIIMCCSNPDEDYLDELLPPKEEDYESNNFSITGYHPDSGTADIGKPGEPDATALQHDDFNPANFVGHENTSDSMVIEVDQSQISSLNQSTESIAQETTTTDDSLTTQRSTEAPESIPQSTTSPEPLFTSRPLFDVRKANITPIDTPLGGLKDKEPIPNTLKLSIDDERKGITSMDTPTTSELGTDLNTIESSTQIGDNIPNILFTSPPLEEAPQTNVIPTVSMLNKLSEEEENPNKLKLLIDEVTPTSKATESITTIDQNLSLATPLTQNVEVTSGSKIEEQDVTGTNAQNITTEPMETPTLENQMELGTNQDLSVIVPLQSVPASEQARNVNQGVVIRTSGMADNAVEDIAPQLPQYLPSLENSTSLRMCRDLYQGVIREAAWDLRTLNKIQLGYGNESNIQWLCTGSLISERYLITAAHCRSINSQPVRHARVGDSRSTNPINKSRLQNFTIEDFIPHPRYNFSVLHSQHDIAVVRLNSSAIFTDFVRPACLATKVDLASIPLWLLSIVPITFVHITTPRCRILYNNTEDISGTLQGCAVTDSYFFCQYDDGAPFVFLNTDYDFGYFPEIVGVASYGNPCGDRPAVSTRVLPYVPWIERIVWPNQ
ncbi:putative trypsin-like serine protease [Trypoxylus dichotomus]